MKSTDWVGNLISITLFSALALASWALSQMIQHSRALDNVSGASGPNAIIEKASIVRTDGQGNPQYRIDADRITHEEEADKSVLSRPVLQSLAPDKPKTVVRADTAIATDRHDQVDLLGNVLITRDAFENQPPTRISTSQATVFVEEERVVTDQPVYMQRGLSTLQGIGLRFSQKTQQVEILSESRMVMPKEEKK